MELDGSMNFKPFRLATTHDLLCELTSPFLQRLFTDPDADMPHFETQLLTCELCTRRLNGLRRLN